MSLASFSMGFISEFCPWYIMSLPISLSLCLLIGNLHSSLTPGPYCFRPYPTAHTSLHPPPSVNMLSFLYVSPVQISTKLSPSNRVLPECPLVTLCVTPHRDSDPHFSMTWTCSKISYRISHPSTNRSSVLGTPRARPCLTFPISYPFPATLTEAS